MKVLVTGAGGFVGGALARRLRARGDEVRGFSRGDYPDLRSLGVDTQRGDLADGQAVRRAVEGVELVFHVGAKAGVWGPRDDYERSNVLGTRNVLDACLAVGVRRLVFTSSPSVVFGATDLEGVDESLAYPEHFLAPYPETKARAEQAVLQANGPDLCTVALRPHLVWGPGDQHLVPRIVGRARAGKLRRLGDGHWKVDTTYIDNAVDAHLAAADALIEGGTRAPCAGKAYFVSDGDPIPVGTMLDLILGAASLPPLDRTVSPGVAYALGWLAETLWPLLGRDDEPLMTRFLAKQLSTAHWFDLSAARRDLRWSPRVTRAEGLEALRRWLSSPPVLP